MAETTDTKQVADEKAAEIKAVEKEETKEARSYDFPAFDFAGKQFYFAEATGEDANNFLVRWISTQGNKADRLGLLAVWLLILIGGEQSKDLSELKPSRADYRTFYAKVADYVLGDDDEDDILGN